VIVSYIIFIESGDKESESKASGGGKLSIMSNQYINILIRWNTLL